MESAERTTLNQQLPWQSRASRAYRACTTELVLGALDCQELLLDRVVREERNIFSSKSHTNQYLSLSLSQLLTIKVTFAAGPLSEASYARQTKTSSNVSMRDSEILSTPFL